MAHVLTKVAGAKMNMVRVKRALLSVSDKTELLALGTYLSELGVEILSTGGTAKKLREGGLTVIDVAEYTKSPEMLDGRVKTLHPLIHGGILAVRGNAQHEAEMAAQGVGEIDLVVVNLYPFEQTVAKGSDFDTCVENIDIGGPSMLRSAAKSHAYVTVVTDASQYGPLIAQMKANDGCTSLDLRKSFAAAAFKVSAGYDASISSYFASQVAAPAAAAAADATAPAPTVERSYEVAFPLKYGCNPHQKPAAIYQTVVGGVAAPLPFEVINGRPGYINLCDAMNAWQLVKELRSALGLCAAASFKHVSPAGAAVYAPLSDTLLQTYDCVGKQGVADGSSAAAIAYVRARNADPMSSFGDFVAISDTVDVALAKILKSEVSDGIIAPDYEPEALAILQKKKGGKYIILKGNPDHVPLEVEMRELHGCTFAQKRNTALFTAETHCVDVVTKDAAGAADVIPSDAVRDMVLASIALKYTQSNSVGYAKDGQMVGIGAGQQSRVDCVKLAGRKVATWYMRQHPKVLGLPFKKGSKRQARVNARVRYIEGDMTPLEYAAWTKNFAEDEIPEPLTDEERAAFMATFDGVTLSSDAFFPFRDSIDHASKYGVSYVVQPGGSVADGEVTTACQEYSMKMVHTGLRLFHH